MIRPERSGTNAAPLNMRSVVATINGKDILVNEFIFYIGPQAHRTEIDFGPNVWNTDIEGLPAFDFMKIQAFAAMEYIKIFSARADEFGITVSGDTKAAIEAVAQSDMAFYSQYQLTLDDIVRIYTEMELASLVEAAVGESIFFGYLEQFVDEHGYVDDEMFEVLWEETFDVFHSYYNHMYDLIRQFWFDEAGVIINSGVLGRISVDDL
jgi:hypothetical protein